MSARFAVVLVTLLVGCGDDGGTSDAPFMPVDIDNGSCGDQVRFTGEYVDWDSSDAAFCGIYNATFAVSGGGTDPTAPNGRFDLCIPNQPVTVLAITQPTGMSPCAVPSAAYTVGAIAVAQLQVIQSGAFWSGRAFTAAREATFFQSIGATYDPTKAQVLVHVEGTPRAVSLEATHGPVQAFGTSAWAPGDTGSNVFFPNVEIGDGTTTLSVAGGAIGTGPIPLLAGTITNVTVLAN